MKHPPLKNSDYYLEAKELTANFANKIDVVLAITMGVADVVVKVDGFTNSSYLFSYAWI